MNLTDELRNQIKESEDKKTTSVDSFKGTQNTLKDSVGTLVNKFKEQVAKGEIEIHDIKDIKDVVSIMQMLNDMSTDDSATPQISAQTANFIRVFTKLPDGTEPNGKELEKASMDVKSDNLQKILDEQANEVNKSNSQKF